MTREAGRSRAHPPRLSWSYVAWTRRRSRSFGSHRAPTCTRPLGTGETCTRSDHNARRSMVPAR